METTIKTKYNIGDSVAAIDSDFVITDGVIDEICIYIERDVIVSYYVRTASGERQYFRETKVYPSREAIAQYILEKNSNTPKA